MKIFIMRHGDSTHLVGDFQQKTTWKEFRKQLPSWDSAQLTELGIRQVREAEKKWRGKFRKIFHSPLPRAKDTASLMNPEGKIPSEAWPELREIDAASLRLPGWIQISLYNWFVYTFFNSIFNFGIFKIMHNAACIMKRAAGYNEPVVLVSHKARILALLLWVRIHWKWRVVSIDTDPAGVTVVEYKSKK